MAAPEPLRLYGTHLSPFALKVAAALTLTAPSAAEADAAWAEWAATNVGGRRWRWDWQEQGLLDAGATQIRLQLLRRGLAELHVPADWDVEMDEFPLVPFVFGARADGTHLNAVDSTAICAGLGVDSGLSPADCFVAALLDEFWDEIGLYMVHHKRWTDPANLAHHGATSPGHLLLAEALGALPIPQAARTLAMSTFNARQTRRRNYLFSSSPKTAALLDRTFERVLRALEALAARRAAGVQSLVFDSPQLRSCDLACFGQLNMLAHLDRGSRQHMAEVAPRLLDWLDRIQLACQAHTGQHIFPEAATPLADDMPLFEPRDASEAQGEAQGEARGVVALLQEAGRVLVPLLKANAQAYREHKQRGQRVFNEAAFGKRQALFASTVDGVVFTHVVKTFQVKVWARLQSQWRALAPRDKQSVSESAGCDFDDVMERPGPEVDVLGPGKSKL